MTDAQAVAFTHREVEAQAAAEVQAVAGGTRTRNKAQAAAFAAVGANRAVEKAPPRILDKAAYGMFFNFLFR